MHRDITSLRTISGNIEKNINKSQQKQENMI